MPSDIAQDALFRGMGVRKIFSHHEWWFSTNDLIKSLTGIEEAREGWKRIKTHLKEEEGERVSTIYRCLKMTKPDGTRYLEECVNTEGAFRIIQMMSTPKAEMIKRFRMK